MEKQIVCSYCNKPATCVSSRVVYGGNSNYGMIWICLDCEAWVGCHKKTNEPLGTLADAELRHLRRETHEFFDPLWKIGSSRWKYPRWSAYGRMQLCLGKTKETAHIAMLNLKECKQLIQHITDGTF